MEATLKRLSVLRPFILGMSNATERYSNVYLHLKLKHLSSTFFELFVVSSIFNVPPSPFVF